MNIFVFGGSSSGKSEYAEALAMHTGGERYYIATMDSRGGEAKRRIAKHLRQREGKGFVTIECPRRIECALDRIGNPAGATLLIESLPTLLANEMFGTPSEEPFVPLAQNMEYSTDEDPRQNELGMQKMDPGRNAAIRITEGIRRLCSQVDNVVIVSDDIFGDGMEYEIYSRQYAEALGQIHEMVARHADAVIRVVTGIPFPIALKKTSGRNPQGFKNLEENDRMVLVIGGYAQGKLSWVMDHYSLKPADLSEGDTRITENASFQIIDENSYREFSAQSHGTPLPPVLIINHFHLIIKNLESTEAGRAWFDAVHSLCKERGTSIVVIADEVGCGIIPEQIDAIRYRESVGDMLRYLAGCSEAVYEIICGIAVQIK